MAEQRNYRRKVTLSTLGVMAVLAIAFLAGRYILYHQIRKAIEKELANLREQEIFVSYDALNIQLFRGALEVEHLEVLVRKDSIDHPGLDAYIPYVLIKGIDLIPFIQSKTLSLHSVVADKAAVTYAKGSTLIEYDSTREGKIELRNIAIENVELPGVDLYVREGNNADTIAHLLTNIRMNDLFLNKQLDSMTWQRGNVLITDLALRAYQSQYGYSAKRIRFDIRERNIDIDSFRVKPVLSRAEFMRFVKKQTDYIDGFVPRMTITGANWFVYPRPGITARSVTTTFHLELYRDKRYPFLDRKEKPLPSHMLQRLPFELVIDTLRVTKSLVRYEEHPEEGDSAGHVLFDDLYATFEKVHNIPKLRRPIRMSARARFMGTGRLDAHFSFPYDTMQDYTAWGSLTSMPLNDVNPMLVPAARAKIEAGRMKKLNFEFTYDARRSHGSMELNYEDLKIQMLRVNGKNEEKVSKIKTLLLNTFVIKKNMDEDVEQDDRSGEIGFSRDPRRSVFNYWWKSLLSGLKDAYNLDDLPISGKKSKEKDSAKKDKKKKSSKGILSRIF